MSDLDKLCRNAVDVIEKPDLKARLDEGKPLRIKAGFDPSAPDIHLGHTVLLRKLREFQDLGHKVIFIIGDYTAMIGDPTGQTKTRPALSKEEVEKNANTYQQQAFKILDKDPKKMEIVKNSEWLGKLPLKDFLENVASRFTIAQILERDDFEKRMAENRPIGFGEFSYPLLQAYDSVMVKADVELGGTDQKFNLLAGRDLQRSMNQRPQIVMTFSLLVGLDGTQKMSKSLGNYIGVTDSPKDVFGKTMSIPDTLMAMYYDLLTNEKFDSAAHPRDAKVKLAKLLTEFLHGKKAADEQAVEFDRVFSKKETPLNPIQVEISESQILLGDLLKKTGSVSSTSAAIRLVSQGGVSIDGQKITDPKTVISKFPSLVRAGKKNHYWVVKK